MIHVSVTQDDIDNGIPGESNACPVALAIKRATGGTRVDVTADEIQYEGRLGQKSWDTPREIVAFIEAFDHSGGEPLHCGCEKMYPLVKPIEFDLPD